jgi:hypothetical protein
MSGAPLHESSGFFTQKKKSSGFAPKKKSSGHLAMLGHAQCKMLGQSTGEWDEEIVRETLCPLDADAALRLPRARNGGDDLWAWNEERTGIYTVRSAYRMLVQQTVVASGSSNWDSDQVWKKLWQLKVVPKVRIFWWQALQRFLPCYAELARRHVMDNGICKLCGHEDETLYHAMLQCVHAKQFWTATLQYFGFSIPRLHPVTSTPVLPPWQM